MVSTTEVISDEQEKNDYIETWCKNTEGKWEGCKRFSTKATLGFCPDFVLPDTELSIDEIMDRFEDDN
jgi:hypothetical protein